MQNVILDVSFNDITTIDMFKAEVISLLQLKDVSPYQKDQQITVQVKIEGNPLNCDCQLYPLVQYFEGGLASEVRFLFDIIPGDVTCAEPSWFRGSPLTTVPSALLTCQFNDTTCPNHCDCHYRIADNALVVNCERADLVSIPDSLPVYNATNHTEIYLSYNRINKFPSTLGRGYQNVTKYLLADNDISYINLTILSPKLQVSCYC